MKFMKFVNQLEQRVNRFKEEKIKDRLKVFIGQLNSLQDQIKSSKIIPKRKIIFLYNFRQECGKNDIFSQLFGFDAQIPDKQNFSHISTTPKFNYELQIDNQQAETFDSIGELSQRISRISSEFQQSIHVGLPNVLNYNFVEHNVFIDTPPYNLSKELDVDIIKICRAPNVILLVTSATASIGFKEKSILEKIIDKNSLEKLVFIFTDIEKILSKDVQTKINQHSQNANDIAIKTLDLPDNDIHVMFIENGHVDVNALQSIFVKKINNDSDNKEKQREFNSYIEEFQQFIENELNQSRVKIENEKNLLQQFQNKEKQEMIENTKKVNTWVNNCEELIEAIKEFWEKIKNNKMINEKNKSFEACSNNIMDCLIKFDPNMKLLQIDNFQSFNETTIEFVYDLAAEINDASRNKREIKISNAEIDKFVKQIVHYNSQFDIEAQILANSFTERTYKMANQIHKNLTFSSESQFWEEFFEKLFGLTTEILSGLKINSSIANICLEITNIYQNLIDKMQRNELFNENILLILLIELILLFSSVNKHVQKSWLTASETVSYTINYEIVNLLTTIFKYRCGLSTLECFKDIRKVEIENILSKIDAQSSSNESIDEIEEQILLLKEIEDVLRLLTKEDLDSMINRSEN